jgi:uncharacterized SAM-binding protein YcdF (DUF218 family)
MRAKSEISIQPGIADSDNSPQN